MTVLTPEENKTLGEWLTYTISNPGYKEPIWTLFQTVCNKLLLTQRELDATLECVKNKNSYESLLEDKILTLQALNLELENKLKNIQSICKLK